MKYGNIKFGEKMYEADLLPPDGALHLLFSGGFQIESDSCFSLNIHNFQQCCAKFLVNKSLAFSLFRLLAHRYANHQVHSSSEPYNEVTAEF